MKRKNCTGTVQSEVRKKHSPASQPEESKDITHWTKVFSDVPKAVLVKTLAECTLQLPELQEVILPKLERVLSQTENFKKHMKVLDVPSISKKLGAYHTSFSKQMKHNWGNMYEDQECEMMEWVKDAQEIFDAIYAVCIDEKTAVGEHEKSIHALNELWHQLQHLCSLDLRRDIYEDLDVPFTVGSTSLNHFDKAFWMMYALVLERAQADPLTPKETLLSWAREAIQMDDEGGMYRFIQKSKSPLFSVITDVKVAKFKSNPSYEDYEDLAVGNHVTREFIVDLLNFLEEEALDSCPSEEQSLLAIKCMLFSQQYYRATKFADKLKEEKDLYPTAAQLILSRVNEAHKLNPSIKIHPKALEWCVDTLGSVWKDVKGRLFREIFSTAKQLFEAEMIKNKPTDFGEETQKKLLRVLNEAFRKRCSRVDDEDDSSDDDSDDDNYYGGAKTEAESHSGTYTKCVSRFKEMKSIPQFPQKKLDDIRQQILCTREEALDSLVYLDTFRTLWSYQWNYSSEYQHLATACEVLLEDNKELIQQLQKEAAAKTKRTKSKKNQT